MNDIYLDRMKMMLQDEFEAYIKTLSNPPYRGLRINTLKTSVENFLNENIIELTATPFCLESYYIPSDTEGLGNHPFHLGGMFYLQEPSASSAVQIMDVQKGDWVLDLCSAPGGKSSQIAAKLQHTGFLVSNEIDTGRANILLSNLERMGVSENMITNANPQALCEAMQGHFDKVLVDAPCSGEGMFKKNSRAIEEWSEEHVLSCKIRQLHILESAYLALKENGVLVYSTCTYSMEENEQVIYEFLQKHSDMELMDCNVSFGRQGIAYKNLDVSKLRRIFPMDHGEGHFIAKLKRSSSNDQKKLTIMKETKAETFIHDFLDSQLMQRPKHMIMLQDKLYLKNTPFYDLKKVKILRQGILCGEIRKNRLEPHQHFYSSSVLDTIRKNLIVLDQEQCRLFLEGNVLSISGVKGYVPIAYHGAILGFGKGDGLVIKNKYPKGMRCKAKF